MTAFTAAIRPFLLGDPAVTAPSLNPAAETR